MDGVIFAMVPALTAYDAATGNVLWTAPVANISGSVVPWSSGGKRYVIGCTGEERYAKIFCVNATDGKVAWQMAIRGGSTAATPVVVGDTVVSRSSDVTRFKITPAKAEVLWTQNGDCDTGSPLVWQDCIYVTGGHCCPDQVRCLDLATGAVKWTQGKAEVRCSSSILADGKIFAVGNGSEILVVKPTQEKYIELASFNPHVAPCTSPTIAGGKLFVRQADGIACWYVTQY